MISKNYISLIFAISIAFIPIAGVSQQADSLKQVLRYDTQSGAAVSDTANVNILLKLAESYGAAQADSTFKYAQKALLLSKDIAYTSGRIRATEQIGWVYYIKGDYQKLLDFANRSLLVLDQDGHAEEIAKLNQLLGAGYLSLGSLEPGLNHFMQARDLFDEIGNRQSVFINTNNIGVTYLELKDYRKAKTIYQELDTLTVVNKNNYLVPLNLGRAHSKLGEYQKAEEQLNRLVQYAKASGDLAARAYANIALGNLFKDKGSDKEAIAYFEQSIQAMDSMQNDVLKEPGLNGIAQILLRENEPRKALPYAQKAYTIGEENNILSVKNGSAKMLYKIYDQLNNAEMALKFHVLHKTFSDSLLNDEVSKEVGRLEAQNEFEKRELELKEQQKQENLENEKQVAEQQAYLVILAALLLASMIGGYAFYRNGRVRKEANNLLKDRNDEIKAQTKQLKKLNDVKTHLFSIISHDLRGPISSLHGIINLHDMNSLSPGEIETMMGQVAQKFKYTSSLLTNLLSWSRSQLEGYQTEPEEFDISKLAGGLLPNATHKAVDKDINVVNHIDQPLFIYADRSMIELILLNLLTNAVKFTPQKGRVELSAKIIDAEVQVCIRDTGVGIPEDKLELLLKDESFYSTKGTENEEGTGLGLMLCKDFIKKNNGSLDIQSTPGEGSSFCFSIPLAKEEPQQKQPMTENLK